METKKIYFVWNYTQRDRDFWNEHFENWLPKEIIDAHLHIAKPEYRIRTQTEEMRHQYWVSEVNELITGEELYNSDEFIFPGRKIKRVAFGTPTLDMDYDANNDYVEEVTQKYQWNGLVVLVPGWSQERVLKEISRPNILGVKPYYSMIGRDDSTRDRYLEASIFEFLPHSTLEVLNDRHAWVTLHVPKADRLGHPDNIREIKEIRRRYPDITLVIAHIGRCYSKEHATEGILPLADDPGLYFDSSAVLNPESHTIALKALGPNRLLYGSDNPIFFMRGRRQINGRKYVNRTNYPFFFNKERESAEIEAQYTLMMYEDILSVKKACQATGNDNPEAIRAIFHDNAERLINHVLSYKN